MGREWPRLDKYKRHCALFRGISRGDFMLRNVKGWDVWCIYAKVYGVYATQTGNRHPWNYFWLNTVLKRLAPYPLILPIVLEYLEIEIKKS